MKKAFDQTVRDIKRGVNKKVLKVPGIEQKVLDATSNEPWGPHGSHLADIAQATRNYHEYQIIMAVIWKRINDTGKNWRHVYKALTVLEYLVANGSERVIDEIKEHAYQISTLSDFQYIDSNGRDQGSNVRKKSQSLVIIVNDKERIQEVRQKAAANRDKFRSTSVGGMYKPGGGYGDRYDDDRYEGRYGSRDEDRNGYGREKESGYRDDDRYGRYGDSYGRDGDRSSRDSEERYGYKDDDLRGRNQTIDDYQYGSRSRSSDRDRDRAYEDDGQYSSRGSGAKADDQSQDGRRLERKFSEQNLGAPPSYEEAVGDAPSPVRNERDGETSAASASKMSSPTANENPTQTTTPGTSVAPASAFAPANKEADGFDEFDPRGSFSAGPTTSNGAEMDLLGSLSESFSSNSLAIMPVTSATTTSEADATASSGSGPTFVATPSVSTVSNQPFEDPFGDGPFKAIPSANGVSAQPHNVGATSSFLPGTNQSFDPPEPVAQKVDFADTLSGVTYTSSNVSVVQAPSTNPQFSPQDLSAYNQNTDILADILPPSGPSSTSQAGFPAPTGQPASQAGFPAPTGQPASHLGFPVPTDQPASQLGFPAPTGQPASQPGFPAPTGQPASQMGFSAQSGQPVSLTGFPAQVGQPASQTGFPQTGQPASLAGFQPLTGQPATQAGFPAQNSQPTSLTGFPTQAGPASQTGFPTPNGQPAQPSASFYGSFHPQSGYTAPVAPHMAYQTPAGPAMQQNTVNILPQSGFPSMAGSQTLQTPTGPVAQNNSDILGNFIPQSQPTTTMATQPASLASTGALAIVPQPEKNKFEPKSTVWADTLSRGLVNFNISGAKINPLADIGIDFDAINRKEKRMEKPAAAPVTSTVNMGKAMGSGSGIGRAGASALRAAPNPMMGSGMGMGMGGGPGGGMGMGGGPGASMGMGGGPGMGMGMGGGPGMGMGGGPGAGMAMGGGPGMGMGMGGGPGAGMGMGGYGGMNQPMGMGIGMNMPVNNGMGLNMGMGQGVRMQPPTGFPPVSTMPGGYNPMMGTGGYGQQPYGSGYR